MNAPTPSDVPNAHYNCSNHCCQMEVAYHAEDLFWFAAERRWVCDNCWENLPRDAEEELPKRGITLAEYLASQNVPAKRTIALSENILQAARDFIWNVERKNVAGWGDCSRDVRCDASFRELRTALAEYTRHIADANKKVEERKHLLELLRSLHGWFMAKAPEHYNGCGLWIDVDAVLNGEPEPYDDDDLKYSPESMVERAVRNARPHRSTEAPRWVAVRDVFGYGSTTSTELCHRFGLDPHEKVDGIKCDCEDL